MPTPNPQRCQPELVERYLDRETTPQETDWVRQHLGQCPHCQATHQSLRRISQGLQANFQQVRQGVDFEGLAHSVLTKIAHRSRRRRKLPFGKILIPLTAAAIVFGVVLGLPAWWSSAEPSAIVSSFTGESASIMLFETPDTRRTVIWINEPVDRSSDQSSAPLSALGYRTS